MKLSWTWFARTLWMRRGAVLGFVAVTFAAFVAGMAFPVLTQKSVDAIISGANFWWFIGFLAMAATVLLLEAWLTHVRQVSLIKLGTFVDRRLANLCFLQMMRMRADRKIASSGRVGVYFQHLNKLRNFLFAVLPRVVVDVIGALIALAMMSYYSVPVAACAVAILAISAFDMRRLLPAISAASEAQFKADGKRLEFFNESYDAIETVKTLTIEGRLYRRWQSLTDTFLSALVEVNRAGHKIGLSALAWSRISGLAIVAIGCYQIGSGAITVGDLIALQLLAFRLQVPVATLGDFVRQYKEAVIALAAVQQFLLAGREEGGSSRALPAESSAMDSWSLEFCGVTLTYPNSDKPAISDVSFRTPERGLVALVGRNGAGKTTLLNILMGLQRDYAGSVLVAGVEIRAINPRLWRSMIGIAAQDAVLFSGTIRSNLDVGLQQRDSHDMERALARAEASVVIAAGGLDREVHASGRNLSGGQRQRTAVARSLIGAPPILVLDEPTAFLDAEAANRLDKALIGLAKDRLLLMVSHNLSATRNADLIVVMDGGRVAGIGGHDDLLENCPEYASLWQNHLEHRHGHEPAAAAS